MTKEEADMHYTAIMEALVTLSKAEALIGYGRTFTFIKHHVRELYGDIIKDLVSKHEES